MANSFDVFDNPLVSGARDAGTAFAQGANGLLKTIGDVYGLTTGSMDNALSRQGQENIEALEKQKSPELLEAIQKRKAAIDAEPDELGKFAAHLKNTGTDWRLWLNDIAQGAPSTFASGGAGAGARVAAGKLFAASAPTAAKIGLGTAVAAGSGIQGTDTAVGQYAELVKTLQEMPDDQAMAIPQIADRVKKGDDLDVAKGALALSLAKETGVLAGLASAATMLVPGGTTVERALVGGAGKKAASSVLRGAAKGAAGEVGQEVAENVSANLLTNKIAQTVEPERELTRGVGETAASSILPSAVMGGMGGAAQGRKTLSQPVSEGKPTAGIPEEPPTPVATRSQLTDTPQVDLTKVENLSEDQFWAAVDARQTMQTGVELPDYQKGVLSETEMPEKGVDPELSGKISQAVESLVEQWKQENPEAADLVVSTVFDPNMLHNGYGIRGAYNRNSQSVLLNAAFLQEPEMVERVLNHEWAHATLATEEGKSALQEFAKRSLPEGELEALSKQYNTDNLLVLVDEWIAKNQEQAPGFIANMVQQVREWLAKFGIVKLTDKEVASVMLRSLRQNATGTLAPTTEEGVVPSEEAPSYSLTDQKYAGQAQKVQDEQLKLTTASGDLQTDSEGFIPKYITEKKGLPTVVGGKNKTIKVPFISFNEYTNQVFKSRSRDPQWAGKDVTLAQVHIPVIQESYAGLDAATYAEKDVAKATEMVVDNMADNLLFLHDLASDIFGPDVVQKMSKWYDGARVIAENFAQKYGISVEQSAAVLACLSPQKHWFANVSLAENVMDILRNHQDTVFDAAVEKAARSSIKRSTGTLKSKRKLYEVIRGVSGKKLSELSDPDEIAVFTRFLSEHIHPEKAYVVTPEGELTPGSSVAVAWSGIPITKNAISAFLNGAVENLTAALGGGHKVRNFYGNIIDPLSALFYTSDTHNVAASLLIPVGGSDFEVSHNFGGNPGKKEVVEGAPLATESESDGAKLPIIGTSVSGLQGTYALYVEAGRRAAEKRGILPRQMQSITWEMVRILFPDNTKTDQLMADIKGFHSEVRSGNSTLEEVRKKIVERMGGKDEIRARPPEWLNR